MDFNIWGPTKAKKGQRAREKKTFCWNWLQAWPITKPLQQKTQISTRAFHFDKLTYLNLYSCTRISITQRTSLDSQHMSRLPTYFLGKSGPDLSVQGQWMNSRGCIRKLNLCWLIKDLLMHHVCNLIIFIYKIQHNIQVIFNEMDVYVCTCCKKVLQAIFVVR